MERDRGKTPKFCWQDAVLEDSSTANICLLSRKKDESEGRTMSPESGAKSHIESFPSFGNKSRNPKPGCSSQLLWTNSFLSCISPPCRRAMRPAPVPGHSHHCVLGVLGADNLSSVLPVHRWRALYQKPRSHLILIY